MSVPGWHHAQTSCATGHNEIPATHGWTELRGKANSRAYKKSHHPLSSSHRAVAVLSYQMGCEIKCGAAQFCLQHQIWHCSSQGSILPARTCTRTVTSHRANRSDSLEVPCVAARQTGMHLTHVYHMQAPFPTSTPSNTHVQLAQTSAARSTLYCLGVHKPYICSLGAFPGAAGIEPHSALH
jgi:hypothetical protein